MNDTVWSSWEEWREACALLFSPHLDLKRRGCHFAAVWSQRGKLPLPIKCTWDLVEAQLLDALPFTSGEQARLCYATAVVRLVNLATEDNQRGAFALSVSMLAGKIGIEKWLVDVRHDCAHHNAMPSLAVLRLASNRLLDWLYAEYWQLQMAELGKDESDDYLVAQVAQLGRIIDQGQGRMRRETGPQLPSVVQSEETEEDTAQDVLERIRGYEASRLAKCLHQALLQSPEPRKWQSSLQWLDGPESRVSFALLGLCLDTLLLGGSGEDAQHLALCKMLLSREYCAVKRETLRKPPGKSPLSADAEDWTRQDARFMQQFAPGVYQTELQHAAKRCLRVDSAGARLVLSKLIVPSMLATQGEKKRGLFLERVMGLMAQPRAEWEEGWELSLDQQLGRQAGTPSPSSTPAPAERRTRAADLLPNGAQPWTVVEWTTGPLGRIKVTTVTAPPPSPPQQEEEEEEQPMPPAPRKRIQLLI